MSGYNLSDEHLRILKLKSENVKKLQAVEVDPDEGAVIISGKNGAGKSSLIDSIYFALAGARSHDDDPVNYEALEEGDEAEVRLEIGSDDEPQYVVVRRWTDQDNTYLSVKNEDGVEVNSPQSLLDDLVGELTFDPLDFTRRTASERREILLDCLDLDTDVEALDEEYEEVYDERRFVNRKVKELEGHVENLEGDFSEVPDEKESLNELNERRDKGLEIKRKLEDARETVLDNAEQTSEVMENIREIVNGNSSEVTNEITRLSAQLAGEIKDYLDDVCEQLKDLESKIDNVEEVNQLVEQKREYQQKKEELESKRKESEQMTERLEEIEQEKEQAIEVAELPVAGLGFSGEGISVDGVPFEQCADSKRLEVAIAIAMELNPQLRIMRVKEGSLLDDEMLEKVDELSREYGFQTWIEVVDDTGEVGIHIEEGKVTNQ